jgi:hypothetical protein
MISMLTTCVLSLLAATGWWWVTWPERTVDRFVHAPDTSSYEALQGEKLRVIFDETKKTMWRPTVIGPAPRTLMDYMKAQQEFDVEAPHNLIRLRVERGRVVDLLVADPEDGRWVSFLEMMNL